MKDENDENICTLFNFETIIEKTKEKKASTLFIIMNNIMKPTIKNCNIQHFLQILLINIYHLQ